MEIRWKNWHSYHHWSTSLLISLMAFKYYRNLLIGFASRALCAITFNQFIERDQSSCYTHTIFTLSNESFRLNDDLHYIHLINWCRKQLWSINATRTKKKNIDIYRQILNTVYFPRDILFRFEANSAHQIESIVYSFAGEYCVNLWKMKTTKKYLKQKQNAI